MRERLEITNTRTGKSIEAIYALSLLPLWFKLKSGRE